MSVLTQNYFSTSNDSTMGILSRDGHQLRSRLSTTTISPQPWSKVDNPMYLDLAIACVSCLGDASEVSSQKISFDKSKLHHEEEQIKRLEFMLGELRIDMQIMFERNCFPAPSVASVGSMTLFETEETATQTDSYLSNESSWDIGISGEAQINFPEPNDVSNEPTIPQHDEYQAKILRLRQENDKWRRENNDQKQTIGSLCHEIEHKNQLLTAAKVFIDAKIKNNEDADIDENFTDNLSRTFSECQRCSMTSNLLAQTQLEKDKLILQKSQLKKIVLSYETEIEILDRKLKQNIAKNVQFETSLDHIRNLQSELELKNEILTHEAHELRNQVAAFEIQRSKNHESDTQTKGSLMPAKSRIAVEKKQSPNELIANAAVGGGFSSPAQPFDNDAGNCLNQQMTETAWQLESKSAEITPGNVNLDQHFREKSDILNKDIPMTTKKGTIPKVNTALHGSYNRNADVVSLAEKKRFIKPKTKPLAIVKHDKIDEKPHLLPNSLNFTTDVNTRKRSSIINDNNEIADSKKLKRADKAQVGKTISIPKSKPIAEKSRTVAARGSLNEKRKCHLTKQTSHSTVMGTTGRAMSTRSHQCATKTNFSENRVIRKSKTKPPTKHQPEAHHCRYSSRRNDDDNWRKKRSSIQQKENQNVVVTNQYAKTDSGSTLSPKSTNAQDAATTAVTTTTPAAVTAAQSKNNKKPTSIPLTTRLQPNKIDRKTSVSNILIRVVHEHEKKQHSKSLTTNSLSTSTSKPPAAATKTTAVYARAERLHHLCQMITERNSIDVLSFDDLKFLNENLNDVTLSEQVTVFASKIDLQERLRQIEHFEKQMQKSKESLGKWCSIS